MRTKSWKVPTPAALSCTAMAKDDRGTYYGIDAEALSRPESVRQLWLGKTEALPAELARFVNLASLDLDGSRKLDWDAAATTLGSLPALSILQLRNCALSPNRFPHATLRALELKKTAGRRSRGFGRIGRGVAKSLVTRIAMRSSRCARDRHDLYSR